MKVKLLLSSSFLFSLFHLSTAFTMEQDSFPFFDTEYSGYRIALTDIRTEQLKDHWLKIKFTAINTGRENLLFGKKMAPPPSLVLNFDEQYAGLNLEKVKSQILEELIKSDLTLRAGQLATGQEVKIRMDKAEFPSSGETNSGIALNPSEGESEKEGGETPEYDPEACSDLIIESVSILKKTKKAITLQYKITNQGLGPAYLQGTMKESEKLAVKAHMSSSENLTRGALPIGGSFISNEKSKILAPGQSIKEEIKLDIRSMTRFTPIIILELDPYLTVKECDETNNLNHIEVQ